MPVLNAESTIGDQLRALASGRPALRWELIIVNDGSRDASLRIVDSYRDELPITVLDLWPSRGPAGARNAGQDRARGSKILFCDADDMVDSAWVGAMSRALDGAHLVGGRRAFDRLSLPGRPVRVQDDELPRFLGIPFVTSAGLGIQRELLERLGGFDEELLPFSCEDIDLSLRAGQLGFNGRFEPGAVIHYRVRGEWREFTRQQVRNGRGEMVLCLAYREKGLLRRLLVTEAASGRWLLMHIAQVFVSGDYRRRGLRFVARKLGWLRGLIDLVRHPKMRRALRARARHEDSHGRPT